MTKDPGETDPNEALREIRRLVVEIQADPNGRGTLEADLLAAHVSDLDRYLSVGGLLPEAWT